MKIKTLKTITFCAFVFCGISASAQTPVYLDKNQPIKQRVEDALSRDDFTGKNKYYSCAI